MLLSSGVLLRFVDDTMERYIDETVLAPGTTITGVGTHGERDGLQRARPAIGADALPAAR